MPLTSRSFTSRFLLVCVSLCWMGCFCLTAKAQVTWEWANPVTERADIDEMLASLQEPVGKEESNLTLREAVQRLEIPVRFDLISMEGTLATPEDPVDILSGETKLEFLQRSLELLELGWTVRGKYLVIGAADSAAVRILCVYDITDFKFRPRGNPEPADHVVSLIQTIEKVIDGDWGVDGGNDSIIGFDCDGRSYLVINASMSTHFAVQGFFGGVERLASKASASKTVASSKLD